MASVRCIHRIGEGGKTNRGQTDGLKPSIQGGEIEGHKKHSGDRILQWNNGEVKNAAYFLSTFCVRITRVTRFTSREQQSTQRASHRLVADLVQCSRSSHIFVRACRSACAGLTPLLSIFDSPPELHRDLPYRPPRLVISSLSNPLRREFGVVFGCWSHVDRGGATGTKFPSMEKAYHQ